MSNERILQPDPTGGPTNDLAMNVLDHIPIGVQVLDANGGVVYANRHFKKITQESDGNVPLINKCDIVQRVLRHGISYDASVLRMAPSREALFFCATPLAPGASVTGVILTVQKVSDIIGAVQKSKLTQRSAKPGDGFTRYTFDDIIGTGKRIRTVKEFAQKVALSDSTVLIEGENGTGKELFAHSIHSSSLRADKAFISINCAAVPEHLLESEFFGHEQGSFTGASKTKIGVFELANEGTLFLDEIGDMSLSLQSKLLRVLQEGEIRRVGGLHTIDVDVRIIAATNRNLRRMVSEGKFREDLYYRLNVIPLRIPPLRERLEDIPSLVDVFMHKFNEKFGKHVTALDPEAMNLLLSYPWPGNVRELESVIEFAVLMTDGDVISAEIVKAKLDVSPVGDTCSMATLMPLKQMEKHMIEHALNVFGNSMEGKKKTAETLGISLPTLYNKLRQYAIG